MKLLQAVVEVDDAATGTVRLQARGGRDRRDVARHALDHDRTGRCRRDMTVVCPSGHESQTTDYCDQCGAPIAPRAERRRSGRDPDPAGARGGRHLAGRACASRAPRAARRARATTATARAAATTSSAPPPAAATWEAIVTADRAQFDRLAVAGRDAFRPTTPSGASRSPRARTGSAAAAANQASSGPRSTSPGPRPTRASPACTRCSSAAPTACACVRDLGSTNGTVVDDEPVADRPAHRRAARRRRSHPRRRVDDDHRAPTLTPRRGAIRSRAGPAVRRRARSPTSRLRFSFWGRSPSPKRSNRSCI